ncbi:hypothetical protein CHELA40_11629 [Chelatococcus asaccharovorans]|nr:hypothetical protein CHELA40_11629 [Chelatococcus asaccharovorans]CAH1684383.1 hypothetical protein CHELA17_63972 [Chelatococcus asaccharovorans]
MWRRTAGASGVGGARIFNADENKRQARVVTDMSPAKSRLPQALPAAISDRGEARTRGSAPTFASV